jgi:serine/threonine-protein kinase
MQSMIGSHIGSYRIVRPLGEGGMGLVYEAVDERIERRAVIKVLHAGLAQDQHIAARFLNEARAANRVKHPGIVSVYEFGTAPEGAPYIIMEFLEGEPLRARLQARGPLGPEALRFARQIASALAAAHAQGVVHRDLKPDNVMIVPDEEAPGGERVKVFDFGIAKLAAQPGAGLRTRPGSVLGTPVYMAPEQFRGAEQVDDRADVYALGILLHEMLAGQPPFGGEFPELLLQHLMHEPPPLPAALPGVSPAVEALVRRMLAKEPAARPRMAEVAQALAQLDPHLPQRGPAGVVSAPGVVPLRGTFSTLRQTSGQQVGAPRRRRLPVLLAGVAVALALLVLGASRVRERPPAGPSPRLVRWSVHSTPAGAKVVHPGDGRVLGQTPWDLEQEAGPGRLEVRLQLPGHAEQRLVLSRDRNESPQVALVPLPRADAPAEAASRPAPEPAHRGSKGRSKGKQNALVPFGLDGPRVAPWEPAGGSR